MEALATMRSRAIHWLARLRWRLLRPTTIGVRGIMLDGDGILLVRHRVDGRWYLPGGGVERSELPEAALRREAHEEAGATLGPVALFGVYSSFLEGKSDHVVVFLSRSVTTAFRANAETSAAALHPLAELPPTVSPGTRRRIDEYVRGAWPAHGRW